MATTWYDAHVTGIEAINAHTRRFFLEIPAVERFDFQPGQFITMDLPVHEKRIHRWKSYSIASPPDGSNRFELCIVRLEGGLGTRYLFEEVAVGSIIRLKGPGGNFVLPDLSEKELVLVCTGTGVAPFRSMLQYLLQTQTPHQQIHLIFGCRYQTDILYDWEMAQLVHQLPGFRYTVALSRDATASQKWPLEIHNGYVHGVYKTTYSQVSEARLFMLCGWSKMVDEAQQQLLDMGYSAEQVRSELYG